MDCFTNSEEKCSERIDTVTKIQRSFVEIESKVEGSKGSPQLHFVDLPSELKYKMTRAGEEDVKVGDKTYKCAVMKRTTALGKFEQIETTWKSSQLPGGVVRRIDQAMMGGKENKLAGSKSELIGFERK